MTAPVPTPTRTLRCLGILHPAYILRGQWGLEPAQVLYLRRAKAVLDGTAPTPYRADGQPAPGMLVCPTLRELDVWEASGDLNAGLACDIEAAGDVLVAIGFCRLSDLASVCVPFRRQGGAPYWDLPEHALLAARWCARLLEDPAIPLVFHNGAYDVTQLTRVGFHVDGWADDTMVMIHTAYPEFPKRLGFLGSLVGLPEWKGLVKQDDTEVEKE